MRVVPWTAPFGERRAARQRLGDLIDALVRDAVAAERERCARVADEMGRANLRGDPDADTSPEEIARRIREGGDS